MQSIIHADIPPCSRHEAKEKCRKPLIHGTLARPPRLELGAYCLEGSCSIQLSYGRVSRFNYFTIGKGKMQ